MPQLAVEAVVHRHGMLGGDPEQAIDELVRMSLVERTMAADQTTFLSVPLAAALFGVKKFEVSPYRQLIEDDVRFLQDLGATTATGLREGLHPRIVAFFRKAAKMIGEGGVSFEEMCPVLEFIARSYSPAWLLLADLSSEIETPTGFDRAAEYVRRFLEERPPVEEAESAWRRLVAIYRATNDIIGCVSAFLRAAEISKPPIHLISNMANMLNKERDVIEVMDVGERAVLFKPLARLMERDIASASATDLSRLAWLHLHAGDEKSALDAANLGLQRESDHAYCRNLVEKLVRYE